MNASHDLLWLALSLKCNMDFWENYPAQAEFPSLGHFPVKDGMSYIFLFLLTVLYI